MENSKRLLEVINKWGTTHSLHNLFNEQTNDPVTRTPKFEEGSFFADYPESGQFNKKRNKMKRKRGKKTLSNLTSREQGPGVDK